MEFPTRVLRVACNVTFRLVREYAAAVGAKCVGHLRTAPASSVGALNEEQQNLPPLSG